MAAIAEGERTQNDVAMVTAVDPRNIGATIKKLTAVGWVQARSNPADARSRLLCLTPAGQQWWDDVQPALRQGRDSFFQGLTHRELTNLEELLGKLEAAQSDKATNGPGHRC